MIDCSTCRFLSDIQPVSFNPQGITSVAKCSLFGLQILNLCVDECTGKMPPLKDTSNDSDATDLELPSSS